MFLHTYVYEDLNTAKGNSIDEEDCNILNINKIMLATGLTPLYKLNTTTNLNSLLKRKCQLKDMLSEDLINKL